MLHLVRTELMSQRSLALSPPVRNVLQGGIQHQHELCEFGPLGDVLLRDDLGSFLLGGV